MPAEEKKIRAVIIIGLKSGERIMMDVYNEMRLAELLKNVSISLDTPQTKKYFGAEAGFYLNGQKHISVYAVLCSQIESVSYTTIPQEVK